MKRLSLVQYRPDWYSRAVAVVIDDAPARRLDQVDSVYDLALSAAERGITLTEAVAQVALLENVDIKTAEDDGRLLPPIDHPDPAHIYLTGTGLTHLGSAQGRDDMHRIPAEATTQTDSMRMFLMGLAGGKPQENEIGVQPEWFYKGNGDWLVASGKPLFSPVFAQDAGEEPEIAGIYLIDRNGRPLRLGFCLANEFSDHVMERENYLWLSHSKLRPTALGPELLTGALPGDVKGVVRILRRGDVLWEKLFLSGEANMSHTIANLEYHHFKYGGFRNAGDVHVHMFGTATLSFSDGVKTEPGDVFEIHASPFRWPLRNEVLQTKPDVVQIGLL